MKGIIFTNFLQMVEEVFSLQTVEDIIRMSNLSNEGAYTEIGTYDHRELIRLVENLGLLTNKSPSELEVIYGQYLFTKFLNRYTNFISDCKTTFEFLETVDNHIHVEVRKLYPDAELPRFICEIKNPNLMIMEYRSDHPFSDLAQGLILGCAAHYKEQIKIDRKRVENKQEMRNEVIFTLTKVDEQVHGRD